LQKEILDKVGHQMLAYREQAEKKAEEAEKSGVPLVEKDHEDPPPYPGASKLVEWRTNYVMEHGPVQDHPLNRKVEMYVKMNDLRIELGLDYAAVKFIKEVRLLYHHTFIYNV
jgi:hypothetical protein